MSDKINNAENPEEFTGLKRGSIKKAAVGIPAIASSMEKIVQEAGFSRGMKALLKMNQKGGFDCPSCAWPDPDDERSRIGEYCENGARALAEEATTKKLDATFFQSHSINELGKLTDYEIGGKGRVAEPMYLAAGGTHYQPISWENAFTKIGQHLNALTSPDEAIFYTSGRTSNEAAFLYQLFVREYGTNNLPDCSNMCHESSGVALTESLGIGKGSVTLNDFYEAEVIMILGQNPGTNHPRMLTALQKAKENGVKIISINPLPETGLIGFRNPQQIAGLSGLKTILTDLFLQVKINGDLPLIKAICTLLLKAEEANPGSVFDADFILEKTIDYKEYLIHLRNQRVEDLAYEAGIDLAQIEEAVNLIKHKRKIIVCWAMGLTQHKNSVDTIKELVNLLLLKGSIGKPGAGTCPVRGHSNVQGDRTVGIYEKPSAELLEKIEQNFGFIPPQKHGYDVVHSIKAMHEGEAKVFFGMGGNFLSATPDTTFTAQALQKCNLTVHVSTKLNRSHLVHGKEALILPCLSRSDRDTTGGMPQFISCENSMGVVQQSKGMLKPISEQLLSEPEIVCRLAMDTLGPQSKVNWSKYIVNYDLIRDDIEKTISGFDQYNARVRLPAGFYLPNCNRDQTFDTSSKKAQFNIAETSSFLLAKDELMMMTIRSHDQFNTTIYGLDDRYRGIYNERRVILMHKNDIASRGLKDGDVVDLHNQFEGTKRMARHFIIVEYPISERCTATYFPETNVLVPIDSVAQKSNTPTYKQVAITVSKHIPD